MRVMVAGATGVVGQTLLPALLAAGHDVVGTTRSRQRISPLEALGATAVVMDGLDGRSVHEAVAKAQPDVVIHQMSALDGVGDLKHFDEGFAVTNRLRVEGTQHLLAAMSEVGTRRMVAQSYTGWPNERAGSLVKTEQDPLDPSPTHASRETLAAIKHLEDSVTSASIDVGIALRYGTFYGRGTGFSDDGDIVDLVRRRRLPIVGSGAGIWSFVHIEDVVTATVHAVENGESGIYNIVDDDPAPVSEWLPILAQAAGGRPPRRVPRWLARLMIGEHGVAVMTSIRGSSNAKAKRDLAWSLRYPSWRSGFVAALTEADAYRGRSGALVRCASGWGSKQPARRPWPNPGDH